MDNAARLIVASCARLGLAVGDAVLHLRRDPTGTWHRERCMCPMRGWGSATSTSTDLVTLADMPVGSCLGGAGGVAWITAHCTDRSWLTALVAYERAVDTAERLATRRSPPATALQRVRYQLVRARDDLRWRLASITEPGLLAAVAALDERRSAAADALDRPLDDAAVAELVANIRRDAGSTATDDTPTMLARFHGRRPPTSLASAAINSWAVDVDDTTAVILFPAWAQAWLQQKCSATLTCEFVTVAGLTAAQTVVAGRLAAGGSFTVLADAVEAAHLIEPAADGRRPAPARPASHRDPVTCDGQDDRLGRVATTEPAYSPVGAPASIAAA